jgi:hypothetical protein
VDPGRGTFTHDDLVVLTAWMADNGYTAEEVAYAVEKPWKFDRELWDARVALDAG